MIKKPLSILLTLAMLLGMVPGMGITAMAGEKTEVAQIETRISAEYVPYAGKDYGDLFTHIDSSIYGRAQNSGSDWIDDTGVTIDIKGDGDFDEWYDIRYQFEAGRTYTAEYTYMINPAYEETYKFTENTTVALTNPDPSKCTLTGEVIEVRDSGRIADVLYTLTIAGERSYPAIEAVTLQKITTPADGVQAETTALMYSNCTLTSQVWSPNVSTFEAGSTYTLTVDLHANDGYRFADDFAPVLGIKGYEKAADTVELRNGNKDAVATFTYNVGDYIYIDTLRFYTDKVYSTFVPTRETSGQPFNFPFYPVDDATFENRNNAIGYSDTTYWYNETDGCQMDHTKTFEAGKVYSISTVFDIKKDLLGEYRFADSVTAEVDGSGFSPSGYRVECTPDGTSSIVKFFFTARFPENEGSYTFPAMCYSYAEFKYAMENDDIRYVALGDVDDMMPLVSMNKTGPYNDNRCPSIWVNSTKILTLLGDAQFTAPMAKEDEHRVYDSLIQVRPNGKLNITGSGSLTFHGNAVGWPTAVVAVEEDGVLSIESGTVRGDTGNRTSFCYAVNVNGGTLYVYDGTLIGTNRYDQSPISAVNLYDGNAYIHGGTFKSRVFDGAASATHYGLSIGADATAYIAGGLFEGISLPPSTQSHTYRMSDYVESGYVMTIDGVKSTPSLYRTISGSTVEVYKEISAVNIHVNSPTAGKVPATIPAEVYLVPDGTTVKSITWYENGAYWSDIDFGSARFEAGNTYKVEIALVTDAGVKFVNPLSSATINYKDAAVTALEDDRETGIVLTVNLGACPSVIDLVEMNITAPKEGETVSYAISYNGSGYQAMGSANSPAGYREWLVSDTGDPGTYRSMQAGDKFVAGKCYKIVVWVQTANHYEFPLYDDGISFQPDVSATVNGYYATVRKAYEQDPSRVIEVEYNFGMCNDTVVEKITVVDVVEPVAGQRPSYTYNILGSGYQMDTAKNAYTDAYWLNPAENWYYIKNGIGWWDVTEEDWVYEHETFIPGHEYKVYVYLVTEDGYEFAYTAKSYENAVTATVNGKAADVQIWDGYWASQRRVGYTFTCAQPEVDTVLLFDLTTPQAGKTPDTEMTSAYPGLYEVTAVRWLDEEDGVVGEFEQGRMYTAEITVSPKNYGGTDSCIFADTVTAYIDGKEVTGWSNRVIVNDDNTVTILYQFRKGASAPEAEKDPIFQWNGDRCTVYGNGSGATMVASYTGGQMKEVVFFENSTSVSLSGDSVKVFFLKENTFEPLRVAKESVKP